MYCGIDEDEINEQKSYSKSSQEVDVSCCKKCKSLPFVILQNKHIFCSACFKYYCEHKFRSTIGKTKLIKPHNKVLIACSGGQNSSAMLNLTKDSLNNQNKNNRLLIEPFLLHIDESILFKLNTNVEYIRKKILDNLESYKMKLFLTKLEMYFNEEDNFYTDNYTDNKLDNENSNKEFIQTLNSFSSWTSKEDFIHKIKMNLMLRIAKKEEMDFIFLGSNGTRLAIQLITSVLHGRGAQANSEICFIDDRDSKIKILKPMREFISKEVTFWNILTKNKFYECEDLLTNLPIKSSLAKVTENFINNLQKDYPATTYTICKIGYKLESETNGRKCLFCQSKIEIQKKEHLNAKSFQISSQQSNEHKKWLLVESLCYGCSILFKETNDWDNLMRIFRNHSQLPPQEIQKYFL